MNQLTIFVASGKNQAVSALLPKSDTWHLLVGLRETDARFYLNFDADAKKIPEDVVARVEFNESLCNFFRPDGIYRHEGAVLTAHSTFVHHGEGGQWPAQQVHITGPSISSVQLIYRLFRQGHLRPAEDWTTDAIRLQDL
jgi:hypothetical protein